MTDTQTHLLGMAQIIIGDGFGAASVRSVLSGIQLATWPDYPVEVFADSASAFPWIADLLLEADRADLARSTEEFLAALEPGRAT